MEMTTQDKIKEMQQEIKSLREISTPRLKLTETENDLRKGIRKNGYPYSVRNNRDRFFYPKEWINFYEGLKPYQKPLFNFLINTGARINEAQNVKVQDIDIINKRLVLRVTKIKAKLGERNPRPRIIPISSQFGKWLNKYIHDNDLKTTDYLKFQSKPAVHICMKKTLKNVGIKDFYMFSTHNIRKTFETWLMALNIDGLKITSHLGHSVAVAVGHYISPDIFNFQEKSDMRLIIGDLYQR